MKNLVLIIFTIVFLPFIANSQSQKNKSTSSINRLQFYTNKAKTWFKDVYVETNFKDHYSYKLMKIELYPVTWNKKGESILISAKEAMDNADTSKSYSPYKRSLSAYVMDIMAYGKDTNSYILTQAKQTVDDDLKEYLSLKKSYEVLQENIHTMNPKLKNSICEYAVYLECYGRNGYGNLILNKYSFTINIKGECFDVHDLNSD